MYNQQTELLKQLVFLQQSMLALLLADSKANDNIKDNVKETLALVIESMKKFNEIEDLLED